MAYQSRLELVVDSRTGARNLRSFENQLDRTDRSGQGLISTMGGMGRVIGVVAAATGGLSFGRVITETAAFEDSMLGLQAVSGATTAQMRQLEKQARTLGATSMYSAQQAGDAQRFLAQAGLGVNEVLSATPGILQLAAAGQMDLAQAADIASNVLGGMRLEVDQLNRVNDVLAATAAGSNTSVSQLGQALSTAAPLAAAAGISIEETAAAIGVMSDAGIQAERAGTGLQGVIRQLSNVTPQAATALQGYGLAIEDVNVETHGLSAVLEALQRANISTADAFKIFGSEAGAAAQILVNGNARVSEFTESLGDAEGEAERMALTISSGLTGAMRGFGSMVSESLISLGRDEGVAGAFQGVTESATGVLAVYNDLLPEFAEANDLSGEQTQNLERLAGGLSTTATVAGGAASAFIVYRGAVATATVAQLALNTAVAANPIGAIITVAGAAAGALYHYRAELGLVDVAAQNANAALEANAEAIRDGSVAALEANYDNLTNSLEAVSLQAQEAMAQLTELEARQAFYEDSHKGMADSVAGAVNQQTQALAGLWGRQVELQNAIQSNREARERLTGADRDGAEAMDTMVVTAERLTGETESLGKATGETAEKTYTLADAHESLLDRITPNRREARQYAQDLGVLNLALASGRMNTQQYMQAMGLLQESFQAAQRDTEEMADKTQDAAFSMEESFDELRLNGLRRLDDGFADMWEGVVDGSLNAGEAMKRILDQTLAEMAHMAITRPIIVEMQGMMGMGGGGQQAGGGLNLSSMGSAKNAWGAVQKGFGGIQWGGANTAAQAGGLYGNVATNTAAGGGGLYANAATGQAIGTSSSGFLGGSTANFGGMTGIASAGAGMAGGYVGTELGSAAFGKEANSSWGATGGALIGTYFGGPIGAAIGGAIGGAVDSFFGSGRKSYGQIGSEAGGFDRETFGDSEKYEGMTQRSALGEIAVTRKQKTDDDALAEMVSAFVEVDNALAGVMTGAQLENTREALDGWRSSKTANIGSIADERLSAVLDATDSIFDETLNKLNGEALIQGLVSGLRIENAGGQMASAVAADMNSAFRDALASGSGVEAATQAILNSAQAVNLLGDTVGRLNLQFDETAAGALDAAGNLASLVGGTGNLSTLFSGFYDSFYTEEEKFDNLAADLSGTFESMGRELPTTREGVRELVEGLQLMGAAGQEQLATVLQLNQPLSQYIAAMEEQRGVTDDATSSVTDYSEAMRAREGLERDLLRQENNVSALRNIELNQLRDLAGAEEQGLVALQNRLWVLQDEALFSDALAQQQEQSMQSLQSAFQGLQSSVSAQQDKARSEFEKTNQQIDAQIDTLGNTMRTTERAADSLQSALDSMIDSGVSLQMRRSSGQDYLRSVQQAGGLGDPRELDRALSAVAEPSEGLFSTFEDYQRDFWSTASVVDELNERAQNQLSTEQRMLNTLERQLVSAEMSYEQEISRLDRILESEAAALEAQFGQLEWLQNINGSVLSMSDAIAALGGAMSAAKAAQQASSSGSSGSSYLDAKSQQLNSIGYEGRTDWTSADVSQRFDEKGYSEAEHYAKFGQYENIPGFATGGIASGPTSGYPVELHGTEAIIPLNGGNIPLNVPGIEALVREVQDLKRSLVDLNTRISENTLRTKQILEEQQFQQEEMAE